jgi:uncharacterized membrane protein YgaE (UPF0421/DUF939 family)
MTQRPEPQNSPVSTMHDSKGFFDVDLEIGKQADTLQRQSHRLSTLMRERTEINEFDPLNAPPKETAIELETSGIRYWQREVATAEQHGGDYCTRLKTATRAGLGSFLTFGLLVFPHQHVLGAVWIGNIFMHTNLKGNFGATLSSIISFGRSIILTTAVSWPFSYLMAMLSPRDASICLPFIAFILSFLIMSSPHLTASNLMILVMWIVVATPVRDDIHWWESFGWIATYLIGLFIALLMNVIIPSFGLGIISRHLKRLEQDMTMLLLQTKTYTESTGSNPALARRAIASIELLHSRITVTIKNLKGVLPAAETELRYSFRSGAARDLREWVLQAESLLKPLMLLRSSLVQRVLGEEYSIYCETLREAKQILSETISPCMNRLMDAMIVALGVCDAWADPSSSRAVLPDVHGELRVALAEARDAVHQGMKKATAKLEENTDTKVPNFAHLTRRMCAFSSMFDMADSLLGYLEQHTWEAEETRILIPKLGACAFLSEFWSGFRSFVEAKWLWHKPDSFRLALKTSVGMVLASLFVSVPYLWRISRPFGLWPGLTVASVNLGKTGSSFHKAGDRLFGTLLAAAYALLATDLFPGNKDYYKVPEIAFFTFVVVYLREADHAYKYTYAATSIGSMLYGSVKNDFDIAGYIPKRIELIFVGIVIFCLTELLLFPRSSRKLVERVSFEFFLDMVRKMKMWFLESKTILFSQSHTNIA